MLKKFRDWYSSDLLRAMMVDTIFYVILVVVAFAILGVLLYK